MDTYCTAQKHDKFEEQQNTNEFVRQWGHKDILSTVIGGHFFGPPVVAIITIKALS